MTSPVADTAVGAKTPTGNPHDAGASVGTLASLTAAGDPWASVVTYGQLGNGMPVLCVSRLALHGRNFAADRRASLAVSAIAEEGQDSSDVGRVTLAGEVEEPVGAELDAARAAYREAVPSAEVFTEFGDFTFWLLRARQVRWVGGFGRMANADRYGLDLVVETPRGRALARVGFAEPIVAADGLRAATVELARRARGA